MYRQLLLIALLTPLFPLAADADEPAGPPARHLRILAVGNSFSRNAGMYLADIAQADGNRVTLFQAAPGGCTLERHWNCAVRFEADPDDAEGRPYGGKSLRQVLAAEPWNFVTIQQRSMDSFGPETYHPYARLLHDYIKKHAPQAEVVVHQTWAYRADDPLFDSPDFQVQDMHRGLTAAYEAISRELGCRLLPVGAAFENARLSDRWPDRFPDPDFDPASTQPPSLPDQRHSLHVGYRWAKQDDGEFRLRYDGHHANAAGCYLGSAVWYEVFFGRSVIGNRFVPAGLDAPQVALLQQIAHQTVTEKCRPATAPERSEK
ncbi:MAG: DUF4886 domain-containing protein [Thermoguttaceae bacterium]|jgi:hypothetical protein|nr:DUF4886 domain-containing protein [Thermoguttaceae bacterium]